ncbi:hypothetical protein, partial [Nocardioides sp. P5_C9_2]
GGTWVGAGELAPTAQTAIARLHHPGATVRVRVRLTNTGAAAGRIRLRGPARLAGGAIDVGYRVAGRDRRHAVSTRGWRSPVLAPGRSVLVLARITLVRRPGGEGRVLPLRAGAGVSTDRLAVVLRFPR